MSGVGDRRRWTFRYSRDWPDENVLRFGGKDLLAFRHARGAPADAFPFAKPPEELMRMICEALNHAK